MKNNRIIFIFILGLTMSLSLYGQSKSAKSKSKPTLISLNYNDLLKNKKDLEAGKSEISAAYKKIIAKADAILKKEPLKVTDGTIPPSGNKNTFFTIARYAWPNPNTNDGMPYITKDGYVNKESLGENYDLDRYNNTVFNVIYLTTAWFYSGDEKYAKKASELLRVWFINPETRMTPDFEYAGGLPGVYTGTFSGIIYGVVMVNMVDYVNLLTLSDSWTKTDNEALKKWFSEYTQWLLTSEFGKKEGSTTNNHSVYYCTQVASFSIYNNDISTTKMIIEQGKKLIDQQIAKDGSLPRELNRNRSFHYSLYGLKAFCVLADCANVIGEDLWNYQTADGRGIKTAIDFILPYIVREKEWTLPNISDDDDDTRTNAIVFIRPAAKAYKTKELQKVEKYITSISSNESEKIWLLGRNSTKSGCK